MKQFFLIGLLFFLCLQTTTAKEEKMKFNLKFGFVKGGEAEMIIKDTVYNGQPAIYYYVLGKTTGLANKLYGVHDYYETIVDAETRLPLKAIRSVNEGGWEHYNETFFYHDVDSINSQKAGWSKVPDNLLDIVSVFFYFIYNNPFEQLQPGDAVTYPSYHADKISDIQIKFLRSEKIETDVGNIDSYVLNPTIDKGKVLKRAEGVKFYISKEKKLPVLITFDMRVGALKAVIKSYTIDGVEQQTE